jgi:hypothetical protein
MAWAASVGFIVALAPNACPATVISHAGSGNNIDFDGDGVADVDFFVTTVNSMGDDFTSVEFQYPYGPPPYTLKGFIAGTGGVSRLPLGTTIGPTSNFALINFPTDAGILFSGLDNGVGSFNYHIMGGQFLPFSGPVSGYVGMEVTLGDGQLHYAAVDVQTTATPIPNNPNQYNNLGFTILDYAYESQPNTPLVIAVPEPASTLIFLIGVPALLMRQRRQPN